MLRLPAPADINGDALAAELTAALGQPVTVALINSEVELRAEDDVKLHKTKASSVVKAHKPPVPVAPEPPLTADELRKLRALIR